MSAINFRQGMQTVLNTLLTLGVGTLITLAIVQVLLRYAFGSSLHWAEEVSVVLLFWLTWVGTVRLWLSGDHVRVDLIMKLLSEAAQQRLKNTIDLIAIVFSLALFLASLEGLDAYAVLGMDSFDISASIKYYPVSLGALGLLLAAAINLWIRTHPQEVAL